MQTKLTPREKEIFNLLIDGLQPKAISETLNISYATVLFHQKKLYRKLKIHNVYELIAKYSNGYPAVISNWEVSYGGISSMNDIIVKEETIDGKSFITYTISGNFVFEIPHRDWTSALFIPAASSLDRMKTMTSFSFKVLGDGNQYQIQLATAETRTLSSHDHYNIYFKTVKGQTMTITVNIADLFQDGFGVPVPFNQENVEFFEFLPLHPGPINIKVWDFRLY